MQTTSSQVREHDARAATPTDERIHCASSSRCLFFILNVSQSPWLPCRGPFPLHLYLCFPHPGLCYLCLDRWRRLSLLQSSWKHYPSISMNTYNQSDHLRQPIRHSAGTAGSWAEPRHSAERGRPADCLLRVPRSSGGCVSLLSHPVMGLLHQPQVFSQSLLASDFQ